MTFPHQLVGSFSNPLGGTILPCRPPVGAAGGHLNGPSTHSLGSGVVWNPAETVSPASWRPSAVGERVRR
jgi:hypothetical protein